ncbi:hypothetical protein D3C72_2526640 [compost metagenome]
MWFGPSETTRTSLLIMPSSNVSLRPRLTTERAAISNSMPCPGTSAMVGSDNFAERANLLQKVLTRELVAG